MFNVVRQNLFGRGILLALVVATASFVCSKYGEMIYKPSPSELKLSYVNSRNNHFSPAKDTRGHHQPDTTAIILNWSRLENVKQIVKHLCDPSLQTIIARVIVWNNNPNVPVGHSVRSSHYEQMGVLM